MTLESSQGKEGPEKRMLHLCCSCFARKTVKKNYHKMIEHSKKKFKSWLIRQTNPNGNLLIKPGGGLSSS